MERKNVSLADKVAAWKNSNGNVRPDNQGNLVPVGQAHCPSRYCRMTNTVIYAQNYGNSRDSDWVVDHKRPVARGGTNAHNNLQAMHNYCNNVKDDNY